MRRPKSLALAPSRVAIVIPQKSVPRELLVTAADAYEAIGRRLEEAGSEFLASYGYIAAAEIDSLNKVLLNSWGGPFNGQDLRRELFWRVVNELSVEIIVETGTFRATTTEHVAQRFMGPIYTCEINGRYFEYSKKRLEPFPNVYIERIDSRVFLRHLFKTNALSQRVVLFYLDAHWNGQFPFREELAVIVRHRVKGLIMVDDFQVPFDPGYGFDDYGQGNKLTVEILYPYREELKTAYFPTDSASRESGMRRGTVLCALTADLSQLLSKIPSLRPWQL
jgi:hypothetical protein